MSGENRPLSEAWKEAADIWREKNAIARLLEDTKSLIFAQKCAALGDIPVNRAEQTIKASQDWYDHVIKVIDAKTEDNAAWAEAEYRRMKWQDQLNADANHRAESRL